MTLTHFFDPLVSLSVQKGASLEDLIAEAKWIAFLNDCQVVFVFNKSRFCVEADGCVSRLAD